jgi:opacity protein-like surface antigen
MSVINSNAADIKGYIGFNYMIVEYEDDFDNNANLGAGGLKIGFDIIDYLSIEARGGLGLKDDDVDVDGVDREVKIDWYYGAYLIPKYRYNQAQIYGIAGFTKAEGEEVEESDFSYGAGLEWFFSENVSVNLEYTMLLDKDDYEVDSFNIGVNCHF